MRECERERETDGCFDFNVRAFSLMQKKQAQQKKQEFRQTDNQCMTDSWTVGGVCP